MIVFVDFDGTLHGSSVNKFDLFSEPNQKVIDWVTDLYNSDNEIVIYSCRSNPEICSEKMEEMMINWLRRHDVPYHRIEKNKPYFDLLIDDRAINPSKGDFNV